MKSNNSLVSSSFPLICPILHCWTVWSPMLIFFCSLFQVIFCVHEMINVSEILMMSNLLSIFSPWNREIALFLISLLALLPSFILYFCNDRISWIPFCKLCYYHPQIFFQFFSSSLFSHLSISLYVAGIERQLKLWNWKAISVFFIYVHLNSIYHGIMLCCGNIVFYLILFIYSLIHSYHPLYLFWSLSLPFRELPLIIFYVLQNSQITNLWYTIFSSCNNSFL